MTSPNSWPFSCIYARMASSVAFISAVGLNWDHLCAGFEDRHVSRLDVEGVASLEDLLATWVVPHI